MDQSDAKGNPVINDRELREGEELSGVFACIGKRLLRSATTRKPYLAVDLRDRRGFVAARAFRDPDRLARQFEAGGLVEAAGVVSRYRGELQLHLGDIHTVAGDPAALLPHTYRNLDEVEGFLEQYARDLDDPELAALLADVMGDADLRADWRRAPCAPHRHYGYCGGAMEHSLGVCVMAEALCEAHPRLDADLLMAAALLHELGRSGEFEYGIDFRLSDRGLFFGHAVLGVELLRTHAEGVLAPKRLDALAHCILYAGRAIPPNGDRLRMRQPLAEALALAHLCALDAEVKGSFEELPGGPDLIKTRFDGPPYAKQLPPTPER